MNAERRVHYPAVIYARVARDDDNGIARQVEACQQFADHHGWDVVDVYVDNGIPAFTDHRPGWGRLQDDVRRGKVDGGAVLVSRVDRIARTVGAYDAAVALFRQHGVHLLVADDMAVTCPMDSPDWGQCPQVRPTATGWVNCTHPVEHSGSCTVAAEGGAR